MVKITKPNRSSMTVTEAAYENFYKSAGWRTAGAVKSQDYEHEESNYGDDDWDSLGEDDYSQKSLSEMSIDELRDKAASMGVDLNGATTAKQIRDRLKRYM